MSSDDMTPAEKAEFDAWRAAHKAKWDAKIASRLAELQAMPAPTLPSGKVLKVDGWVTPNQSTNDVLTRLADDHPVPDTRNGDYPDEYVLDVTLDPDGVLYVEDLGHHYPNREPGYRWVEVGKAVLNTLFTTKDRRVIAIYAVAEAEDDDDMRPLNHP